MRCWPIWGTWQRASLEGLGGGESIDYKVMDTHRGLNTDRRRSGFTRERAGPADEYPWPFIVAAATVFAGETRSYNGRWCPPPINV